MIVDLAESSETIAAFAGGWWNLRTTKCAAMTIAASMAMKMSRPQPARMPSFPMKVLRRRDDCAFAFGSVGFSVGSVFKLTHLLLTEFVDESHCFQSIEAECDCVGRVIEKINVFDLYGGKGPEVQSLESEDVGEETCQLLLFHFVYACPRSRQNHLCCESVGGPALKWSGPGIDRGLWRGYVS